MELVFPDKPFQQQECFRNTGPCVRILDIKGKDPDGQSFSVHGNAARPVDLIDGQTNGIQAFISFNEPEGCGYADADFICSPARGGLKQAGSEQEQHRYQKMLETVPVRSMGTSAKLHHSKFLVRYSAVGLVPMLCVGTSAYQRFYSNSVCLFGIEIGTGIESFRIAVFSIPIPIAIPMDRTMETS
jgi:hypothetical protein